MICGFSVLDQFRDNRRAHPLEASDATNVTANENAVDDTSSLVVAVFVRMLEAPT
jgi:hypothetical protein